MGDKGLRKAHILSRNKKNVIPRHLIFFDVESELIIKDDDIIKHKPYLIIGQYVDRLRKTEKEGIFFKVEEFWEWVINFTKKKTRLFVFAHNVTYDFISSKGFECLYEKGYRIKNFYEEGRSFILKFSKDEESINRKGEKKKRRHSTIEVLNTGNFFQGSVADLGQVIGLPKLDYSYRNVDIDEAIPYCRRDVEIIKKAMLSWFSFIQSADLGNFARTAPGQAFNAFRHRFMTDDIFIHNNQICINLERKSYYGGRVECFKIGKFTGDFYYLDINSMYPFVMQKYKYPVKLLYYRENVPLHVMEEVIDRGYLVCAEVEIETDVPAFPFRGRKFVFPIGKFETYLCTPEVNLGLRLGAIKKVKQLAIYKGNNIFESFVDFFYHERLKAKQDKNKVKDLLCKLILNSLYGKFGQTSGGWEIVGECEEKGARYIEIYDIDEEEYRSIRSIWGTIFEKQTKKESYNSFPAIAGHVTSYARQVLWDIMLLAGLENLYYTDTDSVVVNKKGYENLEKARTIHPNRLGKLKLEGKSNWIEINCPKDYIFPSIGEKHKGIKKDDEYIGLNTWRQVIWPKIGTLIRKGDLTNYYNIKRVKCLRREYNKGYIQHDGVVSPLCMFDGHPLLKNVKCKNIEYLKSVWEGGKR